MVRGTSSYRDQKDFAVEIWGKLAAVVSTGLVVLGEVVVGGSDTFGGMEKPMNRPTNKASIFFISARVVLSFEAFEVRGTGALWTERAPK